MNVSQGWLMLQDSTAHFGNRGKAKKLARPHVIDSVNDLIKPLRFIRGEACGASHTGHTTGSQRLHQGKQLLSDAVAQKGR